MGHSKTLVRAAGATLALLCMSAIAGAQERTNYFELKRIADQAHREFVSEKLNASILAKRYKLPIRVVKPDGTTYELIRFEGNRPIYYMTNNLNAAHTTRASRVWPGGSAGLSLNGSGVLLGIWDGGSVRATHQEFGGRAVVRDGSGTSGHGTHVGGTMIAAGVDADAKGGSFAATLDSYDWNDDMAEMAAAAAAGLRISNHSYGLVTGWNNNGGWRWWGNATVDQQEAHQFGFYDAEARGWDDICFNAPYYLPLKSAGNDRGEGPSLASQPTGEFWNGSAWVPNTVVRNLDGNNTGYDSISSAGVAKNSFTVGAVDDAVNYTGPGSVAMSSFSCWGPTDDGRVKPDIVANGINLYSTTSGANDSYGGASGTSMATPNASGSLGLLVQHHRGLFAGADMRAATLKGLAIHTADECGPSDGPDYSFGWGLLNIEAAAAIITQKSTWADALAERTLADGDEFQTVYHSDGTEPIKITLSWTDPAGTVGANALNNRTPKLVNDLDIRIEKDGTTYSPWVLDPDNPSAAATTGDNIRDNVEQIVIPAPAEGDYTVTVSHKNSLQGGSQAYSMIVSGLEDATATITSVTLPSDTFTWTGTAVATININRPAPAGGVTVNPRASSLLNVPASVVIPAGSSSANFNVTSKVQNPTYTWSTNLIVDQAALNVSTPIKIAPVKLIGTSLNGSVTGGANATLTLNLNGPAPAGGLLISLDGSHKPAFINYPAAVTIPAGESTLNVTLTTTAPPHSFNARVSARHRLSGTITYVFHKYMTVAP